MATLKQYWNDEVSRLTAALSTQRTAVSALGAQLLAAEAAQRGAAIDVRTQGDAVSAARSALSAIAMPADGDPLLTNMETALAALAAAQATLADGELAVLGLRAELARQEKRTRSLDLALAEAQNALATETTRASARAAMTDALTTGAQATLAADAAAALTASEATARARVESEFPTSGTAAKDFLKRARARRAIVEDSSTAAATVATLAHAASNSALAQAQLAYDAAVAAVRRTADAAPILAADAATLAMLAALPAPNPPDSFPILTKWQRALLHDTSKKAAREDALAKLAAIDAAQIAVRAKQTAYDAALHAAMAAEPDKTVAELDATTLSTERGKLDGKLAELATARAAISATESATLQAWFAAVPETLWQALESLDTATARLGALKGPPTPADLITSMNNAEAALVTALTAARLVERKTAGATAAELRASGASLAETESRGQRARAYARSSAPF